MESANKAIIMAFGMLVAVIIMGTIVYVFTNLKVFPQGDDDRETVEQIAAFNLEYEVYDKKIMYGVDVISVLNKAKSNNEKYVQEKFLSGIGYNTDYIIDIEVILYSDLQERISVTYLEQNSDGVEEHEYPEEKGPSLRADIVFKKPSTEYCNSVYSEYNWSTAVLQTQTIDTIIKGSRDGKSYHLLYGEHESIIPGEYTNAMLEGTSKLEALLEYSSEMKQTVRNTSDNRMIVGTTMDLDSNTGWNQATWYPAIYDLKTRKFKCLGEEMVYSEKTGRIIKMVFEEIR